MIEMMSVPKAEWRSFFDRISEGLVGKRAEIEVASLELGDQIVADWMPMLGITYDSRNDLLDVSLDKLNHLIRQPADIMVVEGPEGLTSVAVIDGRGVRQVIRMKEPLMLPAGSRSR